ncbi:MAG: hypothetical protein FJ117_17160 [Deltaproteobacteria bacterium]|nr:hypothetical protein [Deltaproteobacteria bacterium]
MIEKVILCPDRVRKITSPFSFIEHRFLREGFFHSLTHQELLLSLFLVLVSDRSGLSFYRYDKISTLLRITVDEFILARDGLAEKDLLAFDGRTFQVLSLPPQGPKPTPLQGRKEMEEKDPATIHQLITRSLGGSHAR